ncbi:MAG TPA: DUF3592 domain-containing protein [Jiangellaceae bacterium]
MFTGLRPRGRWTGLIIGAVVVIGAFGWDRLDQHGKGVFLAAVGVLIVLVQVRWGLRIHELLTAGERAQGVVVGALEDINDRGGSTYYARVRFTMRDGQTKEFTSAVGYFSEPKVGDLRPVRYRPDDPEQAEVDKPAPLMFFGALIYLFGLSLVVAGFFMYLEGSVPFMDISF